MMSLPRTGGEEYSVFSGKLFPDACLGDHVGLVEFSALRISTRRPAMHPRARK